MIDAPLMLSVSGLRGLVGRSLTAEVAGRFAAAMGQWVQQRAASPYVVIGRDSRASGTMVEDAAAAALAAIGCRVTRVGILSTPGVAVMVEHLHADAGMVITASHNPIPWNGMKPLLRVGERIQAPPRDAADDIIARFHALAAAPALDRDADRRIDDTGAQVHCDKVLPHIDSDAIRARRFKVIVDGVHGAAGAETALLMQALGVELIHLYAEPTGEFPHSPEPTRDNLAGLCEQVIHHGADVGFAQDPDGDRLAIVDETGCYIGEEYTLALTCMHLLARQPSHHPTLVTNLSTSRMIDDMAKLHGATVRRTPVGEANVASVMQQEQALAGGEGNGGLIFPPITMVRDSLSAMALVLEMLVARKQPLSAVVNAIPHYAIVKDKADASQALIERIAPVLVNAFTDPAIDTQDGVRIDWPDRWVHVRPSNTEPIVRFIAEAAVESEAVALIQQVRAALSV